MLLALHPSKNALATFEHTLCDCIPSVRAYHFIKHAGPSIQVDSTKKKSRICGS